MRRIVAWATATVAAVVLLFTYRTSTAGPVGGDTAEVTAATAGAGSSSDGSSSSNNNNNNSGGSSSAAAAGDATVVDGSVQQTRYGPVQVQIKVSGGKLMDVTVLQVPDSDRRDQQINGYAVPILRQAALDAQSADIDSVSGATITSVAYRRSLQSALDAAHIG